MAEPPHRDRKSPAPTTTSTGELSGPEWPQAKPLDKAVRPNKAPTLLGAPTGPATAPLPTKGNKKSPTLLSSMRTPPGVRIADLQPKGPLATLGRVSLISTVVLCLLALGWLIKTVILPMVIDSNVRVHVVTVHGQTRTPMFFPGTAQAVHARSEQWLSFGQAGELAAPLPKVGTHVAKGDILARLKLSPQRRAPLERAQQALTAATRNRAQAQAQVKKLAALKQAALGDLRAAEDHAHAAHPKEPSMRGHKSASHHGKRDVAAATRRLVALDKKARRPKQALEKSEAALGQARENLKKIEASIGETVLRAPIDGNIAQVKSPSANMIVARAPLLLVQDRTHARVTFRMDDPGSLKKGEPVMAAVRGRPPVPGVVYDLQGTSTALEVTAELPDADGVLVHSDPNEIRLVRGFAPLAFVVPLAALVGHDDQVALWILQGTHVVRQRVQVLEVRGSEVVVWDATATMPREIRVVHARGDGHSITSLTEDTDVIAVEEPQNAPAQN